MNAIIIVEVPHSGRVMIWRALDEADLIQKHMRFTTFAMKSGRWKMLLIVLAMKYPTNTTIF